MLRRTREITLNQNETIGIQLRLYNQRKKTHSEHKKKDMNKILTFKTKLSLKFFLFSGLCLFILMPIVNYLIGMKIEILPLILESIIFGFLMSWYLTTQTLNTLKSNGITELDEKILKVKQIEVIQKSFTIAQLSMLLKLDNKTKHWKQVVNGTTIKIITKRSSHSWGENILISILENQIEIESKSRLTMAFIDPGINYINVKTIKDILEKSNT